MFGLHWTAAVCITLELFLVAQSEPIHKCEYHGQYIRDTVNLCLFYQCEYPGRLHAAMHPCANGTKLPKLYGETPEHPDNSDPCVLFRHNPMECVNDEGQKHSGEVGILVSAEGDWSPCSVTCGRGSTFQEVKSCRRLDHIELYCNNTKKYRICFLRPCGTWSEWEPWEPCSATCGGGTTFRVRKCVGGNDCFGPSRQQMPCNTQECPYFGEWSEWSECDAKCGGGRQTRTRMCLPAGSVCIGRTTEIRSCNNFPCQYWTEWIDTDDPSKDGDWEVDETPCDHSGIVSEPLKAECRLVKTKHPWDSSGLKFYIPCSTFGIVCRNVENDPNWTPGDDPICHDLEIRYLCSYP